MKDLQKIKEFFSKPMDEAVTEGNHNAEDFKPYVVKDRNNPNFLRVFIQYPTGTGFTTALGQRTMTGQDREYGAAKAMKMGQAVAAKLESKYNIEDIEVSDNDAGKVIVFAVSDDFIKMNTPSIDEAKDPDHLEKVRNVAKALPYRYNIKPNMGMVKVTSRSKNELVDLKTELAKANLYSEMRPTLAGMFELTVLNSPVNEAKKEDAVDTITMDIPLFLRMLEYSREDAQKDLDLHDVTEKANKLGKERGILQMDDYEEIVGAAEDKMNEVNGPAYKGPEGYDDASDSYINEANVPSNIAEFAKRKGVSSLVRKVAGWAEKVGARIAGGTAVGKNYSTLVLDLDYKQQGEIRIDCDEETVTLFDEPVYDFRSFERTYIENKELDEGMGGELDEPFFIRVSVRDARKAMDMFNDMYRNSNIKTYGSDVYAADTPEDIYDFFYDLNSSGIEVLDANVDGEDYDYDSEYEKTLAEKIANKLKEERPGLWANIHAQRERGEKPARKGSKDYKAAVAAGKRINKEK